jgi:hypothetical protein
MSAVTITQSGSSTAAWGTLADGAQRVYEADDLKATYTVAGATVTPKPGSFDLPAGPLTVKYPLADKGEKSIEFREDEILVTVRHPGKFTEIVPCLQGGDDPPVGFTIQPVGVRAATDTLIGGRKLSVVRIEGKDSLTYHLMFAK